MKLAKIFLVAAALAASAGVASAASVSFTGTNQGALPLVNDFKSDLEGAGAGTLYTDITSLTFSGAARVKFTLVAAESLFDNSFFVDGAAVVTETANGKAADFILGSFLGESFAKDYGPGPLTLTDWSFSPGTFDLGTFNFGIFAGSESGLTRFFIGFDDGGAGPDDNHDDIVLRVDVSPVPLPAAGWMLLAGVGGMAAVKRRRKA